MEPDGVSVPRKSQFAQKLKSAATAISGQLDKKSRLAMVQILRSIPLLLVLIGAALLLYAGSQYWTMYSEQNQLAREWQRQQLDKTIDKDQAGLPKDGLTRLSIPRIDLSAIVVEGTNHRSLLLGPGHIRSTPDPGEPGNSVISGHRDTFFRHIHELAKGDSVVVQRNGHVYSYEVTGKKIVRPTDLSVLRQTKDSRLTLITCYPTYYIGPAPERLVVFAKRSDETGKPELARSSTELRKAATQ